MQIFGKLQAAVIDATKDVLGCAHALSVLDVSIGAARISLERGYCRPHILPLQSDSKSPPPSDDLLLDLRGSRHPIVEHAMRLRAEALVAAAAARDSAAPDSSLRSPSPSAAAASLSPLPAASPCTELSTPAITEFTPNDVHVTASSRCWLLTGPNRGGKSTFLRQIALIVVMGQAGLFVPCSKASWRVVDKVH